MLKYQNVIQFDNVSEFKSHNAGLLEKYNTGTEIITTKYMHIHTGFVEFSNKDLTK